MIAISSYTNLIHKIDSITNRADTILIVHQSQSAKMNSINMVASSLADGQEALYDEMGDIRAQLQNIIDNGIGYSDVVGHITLPLIVALFAFAFPFLFTVISHINNKYESEYTTSLFSAEPWYKWFLSGAAICASYLVVAGILSLTLSGNAYSFFMVILNWTSVILAGGYALIIFFFVRTCLRYNNPKRVIERIELRFDKFTKKAKGNQFGEYAAEDFRIQRLIDLCRYAIRKKDNALVQSIIYKVSVLSHKEKRSVYHNFVFFEEIVESYIYSPYDSKIEDTLMMYWFKTFNKSESPNPGFVYRMLGKMVASVKRGRFSLFEAYWNNVKHGFRFIEDLPDISYVRGHSTKEQKREEKSTRSLLREIYAMHFLAFAYLFSEGYTDVVKMLLCNDAIGGYRLLPSRGVSVLKMYAMCKEHQMPGGRFSYMMSDEVIGENTDPEMLEKFTAMLILITSQEVEEYMCLVKEEHLKSIVAAEDKFVKYGKLWQNDEGLVNHYPQIKGVCISHILQSYVNKLEKVTKSKDIYGAPIVGEIEEKIDAAYLNMLYGNQGYILDDLVGENVEVKDQVIPMGEYTYKSYKQMFTEKWDIDYHFDLFSQARVFQSRYLYMVYSAMKNMNITDTKVLVTNLGKWIEDYMHGLGEEYIVIESGCASLLMLDLDHSESNILGHWKFKKAAYRHYDLTTSWYMKDVEEVSSFENTVIVMKKKDLPYIQRENDPYGPHIIYEDESNEKEAEAVVRITVNPNLLARYNKNAEIVRIKVVRKGA